MDNKEFIAELSQLKQGSTFLTIKGYRDSFSQVADYSIVFNISYENALKRSIATIEALDTPSDLEKRAKIELLESFNNSLTKMEETPVEEIDDCYIRFPECGGIKVHKETGALYMFGSLVHRKVLMPGTYPKKNQKPLTIAKNKMRSLTSVGKFRTWKIDASQVDSIKVQGLSLLPPETTDNE